MPGTSGNLSVVLAHDPLTLAVTASGVDKGALRRDQILLVRDGEVAAGAGRPSAELALHVAIARTQGARAILHTHGVWSTVASEAHAAGGGVAIAGFELLKGLAGVTTHEHSEWLPIVGNAQDMTRLATDVEETLRAHPKAHGVLLRGHGLYTWGKDVEAARRHVETFEFLLEVSERSARPARFDA